MCPACISTAALTIAGATSTSGLTAFAFRDAGARWLRRRKFVEQARASTRETVSALSYRLRAFRALAARALALRPEGEEAAAREKSNS